jgi:dimethylglycine dehydrogenase
VKDQARVVVIGGGVTGCSVLYHLAKMGWSDVVLIERSELTSGSTWHAAGNLFVLTSPSNVQKLQLYTNRLYDTLGEEAGQPIGFHRTGGMNLAASDEEIVSLSNARARARRNGIDAEWISLDEARRRSPILNTENLKRVLWVPLNGHVDPSSVTQAYAAAARNMGATIYRHTPVTGTVQRPDGGWTVETAKGSIKADYVVNAAGLWAREVAALAGITMPLMPVEHHYLVTEDVPEIVAMENRHPTIGETEAGIYSRQEGQGLLLGAYEDTCHHWAVDGTPLDFGHELLPDDISRMDKNFAVAMDRMPCLAEVGIKRVINGPMIFSPDLGPLIGPHPALKNYFCATGVMTGFNQGGGIGMVLAEWIIDGEPSMDVNFWDVARFGNWAGKRYTFERTKYYYENRQERPYPFLERSAGRPVRTFPAYDSQSAAGAVFGFNNGWESPLWYAREGETQSDTYGYTRQSWWHAVGAECTNVRKNAGLFDVSSFAKHKVTGSGAEAWLRKMLAGRIPAQTGKTALCPMLSPKGRIIGDFTVSRLGREEFLLLGAGSMQDIHQRWLRANLPDTGVVLENLSDDWTGLMVAGPKARDILEKIVWSDVSNAQVPFLSARKVEFAGAPEAVVVRVSFTGELGYEIYTPAMYHRGLWQTLVREGEASGLRPAGGRAMMNLRLEKSFQSWGSELSPDYTPMEPGMDRFVDWNNDHFIGRDGAVAAREAGRPEIYSTLLVDATDMDCWGGEPLFRNGEYVGYVTSGGYGHTVGSSLAVGYIHPDGYEEGVALEVEINGERHAATISPGVPFDANGGRMRA